MTSAVDRIVRKDRYDEQPGAGPVFFSVKPGDGGIQRPERERVMNHKILPVGPLQGNCSIIGDETTHEAMVIDPGDDIEDVLAIIRQHKLEVKQIVITHAHIDHVGGAMKLRALTGAPILLNQNDYALLKMLDVQASWIGMAAPGEVTIEASIADGE